jgi:hypothetical protein
MGSTSAGAWRQENFLMETATWSPIHPRGFKIPLLQPKWAKMSGQLWRAAQGLSKNLPPLTPVGTDHLPAVWLTSWTCSLLIKSIYGTQASASPFICLSTEQRDINKALLLIYTLTTE